MASNSSSKASYDVFLSFRGADTRPNFTSHLYAALNRKNITTFIDDSLERGEDISLTLLKVIEESKISVIIFSENYASSRWCLDELLKILECMKTMGQFVIPIFYHVDPSDVRNQTGNFGEAFAKRKERCKELSIDRVERWSNALREAANLSGWDSSNYRLESELSEEVADQILKKLYPISFSASTALVGIDLNVNKIISLLCINPTNVQVIGIWGMGGIGKTTIAEVLVSQIVNQFDCFCFLRNVREESEKIGLLGLRSRFFSELSGVEIKIEMLHVLPTFIKDSLKRKKVLVVLDDVNDAEQLDALAVHDDDCFGLGSIIILISRDKQVLSSVDEVFEVKGLDDSDALQLLSMKAFKQKHPPMKYIELSKRVQTYCKGVPLALKVLGSYLCKRTPEEWETALNKLQRFPDGNIMKVLKISYDDLDPIEKSIFLDIACFFKGYNKIWVEEILNGFDFPSHWGIIRLMDMCLITIVNNKLEMHDLIVEMGQDIARRKGNRLWNSKDICHMLATTNKANKAVEGLFLDMSETERVFLNPAVFSRIPNLRLLKFYWSFPWFKKEGSSFIIEHGPSKHLKSLPNKLSLLHWEEYPFKSLPLDLSLENLVHLIMPESKAEELWNGSKALPKLKSLDLSRSVHLKKLPDFSLLTNLESIKFICCESLIEIPTSIQCLGRLNSLDLSSCKELRSLPSLKQLKFLKNLNLFYCCNLKILPQIPRGIEEFEVRYSGLEEWSQSILLLDNLKLLRSGHFINLRSVPRIKNYNNNCFLDLIGYLNLITLPEIIGNVESLIFDGTLMEELPSSIGCHSSLVELSLVGCERLKSLPSSICKLELLKRLRLNGCSNLEELPPLYGLCSLRELYLDGTALVETPPDSFSLPLLRRLSLNNCKRLQTAVSASYIPPIIYPEGSWEDYRYVFNFCNCVNLDQTARSNIMADALRKFEELAIAINIFKEVDKEIAYFIVSLAGSKIPEWLSYESSGNSVATSLPPGCFNDMFLDFVFCAILEFEAPVVVGTLHHLYLQCESSFRNSNGNKIANFGIYICDLETEYESEHVFFWYGGHHRSPLDLNDWLKQNCYHVNEASFNFEAEAICWDSNSMMRVKVKVKECGFQLIYAKDEVNWCNPHICGATNPDFLGQLKETNSKNKRSSKGYYCSNKTSVIADGRSSYQELETHPKRLRQNFSMENYSSNNQDKV